MSMANLKDKFPVLRKTRSFEAVKYQDKEGNWRVKIVAQRNKFNDEAKAIFLEQYAKHARMGQAATEAGVTPKTVREHMKTDQEFAEACFEAEHTYKDRLIEHVQNLVFEGIPKRLYDRNGQLISEEKTYPIRLIELEMKKHDEGYREKREVDMNMKVSGGVMVTPPEVSSIDDWESKFGKGEIIEGTIIPTPNGDVP